MSKSEKKILETPHYQTCVDTKCPEFKDKMLTCETLKCGNCKLKNVHLLAARPRQHLNNKKHGLWVIYNGSLTTNIIYVNGKKDGLECTWITYVNNESEDKDDWFEVEQMIIKDNFVNDKLEGNCYKWYNDGDPAGEYQYEDGKMLDGSKEFDADGNISRIFENGEWKETDENQKSN